MQTSVAQAFLAAEATLHYDVIFWFLAYVFLCYCFGATLWLRRLRVRVFLEFMALVTLKFVRVPDPFGDRGNMPLMAAWG